MADPFSEVQSINLCMLCEEQGTGFSCLGTQDRSLQSCVCFSLTDYLPMKVLYFPSKNQKSLALVLIYRA